MDSEDHRSNTGLVLGLGLTTASSDKAFDRYQSGTKKTINIKPCSNFAVATGFDHDDTSLTLALSGEHDQSNNYRTDYHHLHVKKNCDESESPQSAVSNSFSSGRVKRERDLSSEEIIEVERVISSSRVSTDEDDQLADGNSNARKKLRLTKEQSALLEESFKQHSTLNPKQKQALAKQLNLRPRQVEVWFQNRRARTKLKQTEVDCELLKKWCETLTDENRRLQKEVQELKAVKVGQPLYMHMPAATLTMCPSCERVGGVSDGASKIPFSMAPKPHFFNAFTNPAAC